MGYRSDVRCLIYGPEDQIDALLMREALGANRLAYWQEYYRVYYACRDKETRVKVIDFDATDVKWYDSYTQVQNFETFRSEVAQDVETTGLCVEWCCAGEDVGDNTAEYNGDCVYALDIERKIVCDMFLIQEA